MSNIITPQRYQGSQLALLNSSAPSQKEGTSAKAAEGANGGDEGFQVFGSDGFTFSDFIDIINPLQHIPLVSTLYRNATGDTIDPGSQIAGGTLFGGPIGAVASIINVAVGEATGMDLGDYAVALFSNEQPKAIDPKFAEAETLANFETAAGLPKKEAYAAPTGAEAAVLNSERAAALAETYPGITGAEAELLKAESREAANVTKTRETGAEVAILEAEAKTTPDNISTGAVAAFGGWFDEAKTAPRLTERLPSPIADETGVLEWARKEARIAAEKRIVPDNASTGAVAALGGWFSEANYSAAASYRQGAALGSAVKPSSVNLVE